MNRISFLAISMVVMGLAALAVPPAYANQILTYTGRTYTEFNDGPPPDQFTADMYLSGWIELAGPLGSNFSGYVSPLNFIFSNGRQTVFSSPVLPGEFLSAYFVTNGSGVITGWYVQASQTENIPWFSSDVTSYANPIDSSNHDSASVFFTGSSFCTITGTCGPGTDLARNTNSPGTWAVTQTAVPEVPSSILLLTSLAGIGFIGRKLFTRG